MSIRAKVEHTEFYPPWPVSFSLEKDGLIVLIEFPPHTSGNESKKLHLKHIFSGFSSGKDIHTEPEYVS